MGHHAFKSSLPGFAYFMCVSFSFIIVASCQSLLMNCVSLGNKYFLVVIVIVSFVQLLQDVFDENVLWEIQKYLQ